MNPAIKKLTEYLAELEAKKDFASLEDKANHIGIINQVSDAIGQLKLCETHGITSGSLVSVLPETETPNFCYLAVHENESSNPEDWEEVLFNQKQVRLSGGDLVVRK